jgi:hypothetical protein
MLMPAEPVMIPNYRYTSREALPDDLLRFMRPELQRGQRYRLWRAELKWFAVDSGNAGACGNLSGLGAFAGGSRGRGHASVAEGDRAGKSEKPRHRAKICMLLMPRQGR